MTEDQKLSDMFAEFAHQEGAAQRPYDFADRLMELFGQAVELSLPGHDRDCAIAMVNQARLRGGIDEIQVAHLLAIGHRAGVAAGRGQAADAIRATGTQDLPPGELVLLEREDAAELAECAPAEPADDVRIGRLLRRAYEADPDQPAVDVPAGLADVARRAERLNSLSLECQQRVCSGCDGLKWGPGNTPCAHDCHHTEGGIR